MARVVSVVITGVLHRGSCEQKRRSTGPQKHKADAPMHLPCVLLLGALFPFDVAAYAGSLFGWHRFTFKDGIKGRSQVIPVNGDAVSRPAVVHLALIDELSLPVE